jgi:ActR/RegA family two-component response regulator
MNERYALIVNDDHLWLDIFARIVEGCGYHVVIATNVASARARLASQSFEAILVDVRIAGNGGDFLEVLREAGEGVMRRSVVVTGTPLAASAFAGELPIVDKFNVAGIVEHLRHPVRGET